MVYYVEMYDFILARCGIIIVMRFVISKIYLLGCSILHHASLSSRVSIHSEIHGEERTFCTSLTPSPLLPRLRNMKKAFLRSGIGKHRFHCEDASDVYRPYYSGEI